MLNAIGDEEWFDGRPDLACLVVAIATGFPDYVAETVASRREAMAERQRVFDHHRPNLLIPR